MIIYVDSCKNIEAAMLNGFFEGWPDPPSTETHLEILRNSDYIIVAVDDENKKVAGFITAHTDHVLSAYIPLLEVLPAYRRRGIGSMLLSQMKEKLQSFYMVDLICDEEKVSFYQKLGMKKMSAMSWRNYNNQNGKGDFYARL
ncbi:MAG: GNAT family N-acetyltransferase [Vulcanimicrobiota bacterium]